MQNAIYNPYFGFSENPFNISPDPEFLYRSPQHEEALANLIYGVRSRKGFIVLTGEVGTGKTTMLECLRDYLDTMRTEFAFIFNSRLTPDQFFEMMAYDFDLDCERKSKTDVLFALNTLLIKQAEKGRTCVLLVDEAHNLEWDVLEEIRLLGNLENRGGKLLQIILAGQPELDRKLDAPNLRQLKQRIVLRCNLSPLEPEEAIGYIDTRMARAGIPDQKIFSPELLEEVYKRSRGIPRVINLICDNLLVTAFAMECKTCTFEMLDEVCHDLRLEWPGSNRDRRGNRSRYGMEEEHFPDSISARGD
jgi:general secretion pathway protein A